MTNNGDILAITNAIQYFQNRISPNTQPQQLETHMANLKRIIDADEVKKQMPNAFLVSLINIVAQRYYQLATCRDHNIKEEYLLVTFVGFVEELYHKALVRTKSIKKDLMVIMMSATLTLSKSVFEIQTQKYIDLKSSLLHFNSILLTDIVARQDFKVEQIYPKQYSLSSNILKTHQLSLKNFTASLQTLTLLIRNNSKLRMKNDTSKFNCECLKRLLIDVKYLCDTFYKYELGFKKKVQVVAVQLLKIFQRQEENKELYISFEGENTQFEDNRRQLFSNTVLLAQLSGVPINFNSFTLLQRSIIEYSYHNLYVSTSKLLIKTEVNIELKKQELSKLIYLVQFVKIQGGEDDQILSATVQLLSKMFMISARHSLISIPHHATTIPLDRLQPSHTTQNYPLTGLEDQYRKEQTRIIVELMPFFQLQLNIVDLTLQFFKKLPVESRLALLKHFSDELLKYQYSLNMSLVNLYTHIQILCVIEFVLTTTSEIESSMLVYRIFECLGNRSEVVKRLKASYVEQELLISINIQIINKCCSLLTAYYNKQADIKGKIKISQITITLLQKILNQLSEPSYIIRLACTIALLGFSARDTLQNAIRPYQATIVLRNKNNLELILNLLEITTMNQVDYQELAEYYLKHKGAQPVLRFLLPKVSIQMGRKCLLTVQRWWILLNRTVIEWLNCKEMKAAQNQAQIFATNDKENVSIRNALGVIIIEMGQKWIFYLKSQKRETVVDILINLAEVNAKMVFFKSGFTKIIKELYRLLLQCLGKEQVQVTVSKHKKDSSSLQDKQSLSPTTKIQFYNRLRQKIYSLFILLPQENFQLYDRQAFQMIKQLLLQNFEAAKKEYLFAGNTSLKYDYDLLKQVALKLQSQ